MLMLWCCCCCWFCYLFFFPFDRCCRWESAWLQSIYCIISSCCVMRWNSASNPISMIARNCITIVKLNWTDRKSLLNEETNLRISKLDSSFDLPNSGTLSDVCGVISFMIVRKIQMARETVIWRPIFSPEKCTFYLSIHRSVHIPIA